LGRKQRSEFKDVLEWKGVCEVLPNWRDERKDDMFYNGWHMEWFEGSRGIK
jgi:hypothetical protein